MRNYYKIIIKRLYNLDIEIFKLYNKIISDTVLNNKKNYQDNINLLKKLINKENKIYDRCINQNNVSDFLSNLQIIKQENNYIYNRLNNAFCDIAIDTICSPIFEQDKPFILLKKELMLCTFYYIDNYLFNEPDEVKKQLIYHKYYTIFMDKNIEKFILDNNLNYIYTISNLQAELLSYKKIIDYKIYLKAQNIFLEEELGKIINDLLLYEDGHLKDDEYYANWLYLICKFKAYLLFADNDLIEILKEILPSITDSNDISSGGILTAFDECYNERNKKIVRHVSFRRE